MGKYLKVIVQTRIDPDKHEVIKKNLLKKGLTFYTYMQKHLNDLYLELKK